MFNVAGDAVLGITHSTPISAGLADKVVGLGSRFDLDKSIVAELAPFFGTACCVLAKTPWDLGLGKLVEC